MFDCSYAPVRLIAELYFFNLTFGDKPATVAPTLAHFKPLDRTRHHGKLLRITANSEVTFSQLCSLDAVFINYKTSNLKDENARK